MNTKNVRSLFVMIVCAYLADLYNELVNASGASLADEVMGEMFDNTLMLKTGGVTPVVGFDTNIKVDGTAVDLDDEYQAIKFARYLALDVSEADFDTHVLGGTLLNVAVLSPQSDSEDLSTISIVEKIARCIEGKFGRLNRASVNYRTALTNLRSAMAA